eukprot:g5514.t1
MLTKKSKCVKGAAIIVIRLDNGRFILHTGDFRYGDSIRKEKTLQQFVEGKVRLSMLYLDTTYCNPFYSFPKQEKAIADAMECLNSYIIGKQRTLIVFGSYAIGKERVWLTAIQKFNIKKIFVAKDRLRKIQCFGWNKEIMSRLTTNPALTRFHVVSMGVCTFKGLEEYRKKFGVRYTQAVAFKATGWAFNKDKVKKATNDFGNISNLLHSFLTKEKSNSKKRSKKTSSSCVTKKVKNVKTGARLTIFAVPYSEHSSFVELQQCIHDFKPLKIIPTVRKSGAESLSMLRLLKNS